MSSAVPQRDPLVPQPQPAQIEPCRDNGELAESPRNREQLSLLIETLHLHFSGRDDVFIAGNMGLYYSSRQIVKNDLKAPDFFAVLGVPFRERTSWVVWEEERGPDLVIELLSASTASNDRGHKKTIYARSLRVPEYYLFDPKSLEFQGFRLDLATLNYSEMPVDARGGCLSAVLGLRLIIARGTFLGIETDWLRWAHPDGTILPTEAERANGEKQRAESEKQRAESEKQRADRLVAQLLAAGITPSE